MSVYFGKLPTDPCTRKHVLVLTKIISMLHDSYTRNIMCFPKSLRNSVIKLINSTRYNLPEKYEQWYKQANVRQYNTAHCMSICIVIQLVTAAHNECGWTAVVHSIFNHKQKEGSPEFILKYSLLVL